MVEAKRSNELLGMCYETFGMLEDREPGVVRLLKLIPSTNPQASFTNQLCSITVDMPGSICCYLHAAGYYSKARRSHRCAAFATM